MKIASIKQTKKLITSNEKVHFRLINMPCCNHLFCNVNHRLPSYCINCGTYIFDKVKENIIISDKEAWLKYKDITP